MPIFCGDSTPSCKIEDIKIKNMFGLILIFYECLQDEMSLAGIILPSFAVSSADKKFLA